MLPNVNINAKLDIPVRIKYFRPFKENSLIICAKLLENLQISIFRAKKHTISTNVCQRMALNIEYASVITKYASIIE